ncbi:MAG: NADH-quinone oxidoreductase subunit J [Opitutales bacterium]|nr:NADH-quinone oxidoreductase subunit J [Opitutales bacterium]MCH8540736.1 NADH-quinone oxidoreductase subunit J [Opitutales bacterium]
MLDFLFYFLAALTLGSAFMVVASRNAVNAAMFLIVTVAGVAGLFVLLGAYFLAVLQILVYAGAVVVLFLFVIMLLDDGGEAKVKPTAVSIGASLAAFMLLLLGVLSFLGGPELVDTGAAQATETPIGANLQEYGRQLFSVYLLPVQVAGFLLLIAMIGVILISKRHQEEALEE